MAFNIETFIAEHGKRNGFMRANRFEIKLTPPVGILQQSADLPRSLSFWCSSVQIPGYQFITHDVRRYSYGTNESRPFAPNFEPIQLNFYSDGNGEVLDFWHRWMEYIMPHDMSAGINNNNAYLLKYKDDYVTDMQITYYKETGEPIKNVTVRSAFPININSIPLSWAEQNTFVNFAVFIDFLDWYIPESAPVVT